MRRLLIFAHMGAITLHSRSEATISYAFSLSYYDAIRARTPTIREARLFLKRLDALFILQSCLNAQPGFKGKRFEGVAILYPEVET
jgi:hypothetical protein